MATIPDSKQAANAARFEGLDPEELIRAFRIMHTARRLDDREIALKRQNRIFFQISGAGHEAVQVAAGMVLRAGHDWFYPYYRDRACASPWGSRPTRCCSRRWARRPTRHRAGGRCPRTGGTGSYNIVSSSSPTGTQFLQAVGCAEASRYRDPATDEVTLVCSGEGATSEGEFWEALNVACLERLPVLFLIEDNGYAISVPIECQTAGGSISQLARGFPGAVPAGGGRHRLSGLLPRHEGRGGVVPRGQRAGAGACPRDPALLALAFRRRAAVQDQRRAPGRGRARSGDPCSPSS